MHGPWPRKPPAALLTPPRATRTSLLTRQAGLKTGMYYLRTRAAADAIKFTVDTQSLARNKVPAAAAAAAAAAPAPAVAAAEGAAAAAGGALTASSSGSSIDEADRMMEREKQLAAMVCSLENKDACLMCGS
jgi:hypothetical protein